VPDNPALLPQLVGEYDRLCRLEGCTPQYRGQLFNELIARVLRCHGIDARANRRNIGEIDVSFSVRDVHFVLEAKWLGQKVDTGAVAKLQRRVGQRLNGTHGVFLSMSGYSGEALADVKDGQRLEVLLLDRSHWEEILHGRMHPAELLRLARKSASLEGRAYTPVEALRELVRGDSAAEDEQPVPSASGSTGPRGRQQAPDNAQASAIPSAVRSAYLEQVRQIAPPELVGREIELAELGRFCLDPDGPSYAWWRAGPWAGKSALLSSFVLRPPAEVAGQVRIVSFFITARLAAQNTREAFARVVLEQLAALLGQSLPEVLPESMQDTYLLDLMSQAAAGCEEAGSRLVLVVDGLDEDRGVTTGPDVHSIAGLLPGNPPYGMRVIVAGRPDPPIPGDVPDWHPLRDQSIVRPLDTSPYARDVQRLSRQELHRLLAGALERDVLGLLTAAHGGLTARDLAELADTTLWDVEKILHTSAGRTLQSRPSLLSLEGRPDVYLLGHDELQVAAIDYLGDRIEGYCERLHSWADCWRSRGWPSETPEYLNGRISNHSRAWV
jgi:hypothetical protein